MTHFGEYGRWTETTSPNPARAKFLRPLPHGGDSCSCYTCDGLRRENSLARTSINWPADYPPKFYEQNPPEEEWFGEAQATEEEIFQDSD